MNSRPSKISKVLSANDVGETGGRMAGILVPKATNILSFFPTLDSQQKNPRCVLSFLDDWNESWTFAFIYYNNRFWGGTRNEYRLTRMTRYLRQLGAKSGDSLTLSRSPDVYRISSREVSRGGSESGPLKLGTEWKVIKF